MSTKFQFYNMKKVLKMYGGDGCTQWECIWCHQTIHLKMVKMLNFIIGIFHHNNKKRKRLHNSAFKSCKNLDQ